MLSFFPFKSINTYFMYVGSSAGFMYIYKYYISLLGWLVYYYVMPLFIFYYSLCFKIYFVWYEL